MSATTSTPTCTADIGDRVAIETPQRDVRVGDVVDMIYQPVSPTPLLVVEVDGCRFRVAAADADAAGSR